MQCDNAWADIDVQLKRRYDLIPNLVETVKGYAAHEKGTLEGVVAARNQAMSAQGPAAKGEAEGMLTGALRQVFALAEAYPQLRAVESFTQLQTHAQSDRRHAAERAALLQRRGARLQYHDRAVPVQYRRGHGQFQGARILRDHRAGRTRSAEGQLRHDGRLAAMRSPMKHIGSERRFSGVRERAFAAANALRQASFRRRVRCWLLLLIALAASSASARQLKIEKFSAEIFVQPDSSLDVTETIEVNFIGAWHGLYRTIPVEYVTPQGFNYSLFVKLEGATDAAGQPLKVESSRERPLPEIENLCR